jgi:hypothetical protein
MIVALARELDRPRRTSVRARAILFAASIVLAVVLGVWAGGAVRPAPGPTAADATSVQRLDAARTRALTQLGAATTRAGQRNAALALADRYRAAARALPRRRAPLEAAARAYGTLAQDGATPAASHAVARAEARLQAALLRSPEARRPAIPPALPLVLLAIAVTGFLIGSRLPTTPKPQAPSPRPRPHTWDTPPPGI